MGGVKKTRKKIVSGTVQKPPFWALAWILLVVALHYAFSYLFDAKYSAIIEKFFAKIFG